jgi:hypothetical protein
MRFGALSGFRHSCPDPSHLLSPGSSRGRVFLAEPGASASILFQALFLKRRDFENRGL